MVERPTRAEKADAADRFMDCMDEAHAALNKAAQLLRERADRGSSRSYPLFFDGEKLDGCIGKAREFLWAAHKLVAVQGYDEKRAMDKEAAADG